MNPNYAKEKIARCFSAVNIEQTKIMGFNPNGFGPAHRQRRAKALCMILKSITAIPACRTGRNDGAIAKTILI
ncbi:MAG: hypothetical protein D8M61_18680 [Ignavibacteriae bacterium]|nr:hypothetical protein [Ignavibacteriota bacterium]